MSCKKEKEYRFLMNRLCDKAYNEWIYMSFWQKLKWRFNAQNFVEYYINCHKESYLNYWSNAYENTFCKRTW